MATVRQVDEGIIVDDIFTYGEWYKVESKLMNQDPYSLDKNGLANLIFSVANCEMSTTGMEKLASKGIDNKMGEYLQQNVKDLVIELVVNHYNKGNYKDEFSKGITVYNQLVAMNVKLLKTKLKIEAYNNRVDMSKAGIIVYINNLPYVQLLSGPLELTVKASSVGQKKFADLLKSVLHDNVMGDYETFGEDAPWIMYECISLSDEVAKKYKKRPQGVDGVLAMSEYIALYIHPEGDVINIALYRAVEIKEQKKKKE